uniref:Uncharacterized protein n=1 Tax=Mus musculus TaxID=10090 RepID=Q8BNV2_MOUSE|nr:unnamed protein product [Mus musculus]
MGWKTLEKEQPGQVKTLLCTRVTRQQSMFQDTWLPSCVVCNSPGFVSHLAVGVLGVQMYITISSFLSVPEMEVQSPGFHDAVSRKTNTCSKLATTTTPSSVVRTDCWMWVPLD